jgi:two-component system sensor histidine kinase KdpD
LIGVIDRQANTLDRLAARLLRTARLDSTDFKPQCEPLLLSSLVAAAIEGIDLETERGRFQVAAPGREVPIWADRELILSSLAQLVDNAIKYSEPQSPVAITFVVGSTEVVFKMRSKGLVVGPSDCVLIFERFYRARETQHLPAGTGLGLSIVKRIVDAHHGRVWAEGEPGFGTSFSISLPAAAGN